MHSIRRELPDAPEPLVHRLTLEQLHDDERAAIRVMAEVEDLDDAGVGDPGHRACFVEEPFDDSFVRRQRRKQNLDRRFSAEQRVFAEVHGAHPPLADFFQNPVGSNDRSRQQGRYAII